MLAKRYIIIASILAISSLFSCIPRNKTSAVSVNNIMLESKINFPELVQLSYIALSDTLDIQQYYLDFLQSN